MLRRSVEVHSWVGAPEDLLEEGCPPTGKEDSKPVVPLAINWFLSICDYDFYKLSHPIDFVIN